VGWKNEGGKKIIVVTWYATHQMCNSIAFLPVVSNNSYFFCGAALQKGPSSAPLSCRRARQEIGGCDGKMTEEKKVS